jgi:hypothetical protein
MRNPIRFAAFALAVVLLTTGFRFRGCGGVPRFTTPKVPPPKFTMPKFKPVEMPMPRHVEMPHGIPEGPGFRVNPHNVPPRLVLRPPVLPRGVPVGRMTPEVAEGLSPKVVQHLDHMTELGSQKNWTALGDSAQELLHTSSLPAELTVTVTAVGRQAKPLDVLENLEALVGKVDAELPSLTTLNRHLTTLAEATGDVRLARRCRQYLAFEAELKGQTDLARQLVGTDALVVGSSRARLRDLKVSILGEANAGEAAAKSGRTAHGPGPIPEGPAEGLRPKVKEATKADLPPLKEEMAAADKQFRARLKEDLGKQKEMRQHYLQENAHLLHALTHRSKEDDEWRKKMESEEAPATVARLVGRDLTATERLLVPKMLARGKRPAEIAQFLLKRDKAAAHRAEAGATKTKR